MHFDSLALLFWWLGKKYKNIFVQILVQMKTLKSPFEINWPLTLSWTLLLMFSIYFFFHGNSLFVWILRPTFIQFGQSRMIWDDDMRISSYKMQTLKLSWFIMHPPHWSMGWQKIRICWLSFFLPNSNYFLENIHVF